MKTITILDKDRAAGLLAFDLRQLLELISAEACDTDWEIRAVESIGQSADQLHEAADTGARVPGPRLLQIVQGIDQVVDGEFRAFSRSATVPWIILRAVDSSAWDVASDDEEILDRFRGRFRVVVEAGDQGW